MITQGKTVADVCRVIEVTQPTYHRLRQQYGGMQAEEAKRLTQLEKENARLKKLLAEASAAGCGEHFADPRDKQHRRRTAGKVVERELMSMLAPVEVEKTPGRFWAQIGPISHILESKRPDIHCAAVDQALFRKPCLGQPGFDRGDCDRV
jgi:hypothetical protein